MAIAIAIFLRGKESYEDSYNRSSARGMGISLKKYKMLFRTAAVLLMLLGLGIFYWFYLSEPENPNAELNDFWQNVEKNKVDSLMFNTIFISPEN
jgi:hypothetical protein